MSERISESVKRFCLTEGQSIRHLDTWLQKQPAKTDYLKGKLTQGQDNPSVLIICVTSKLPRQRSRELLSLACQKALSADEGLPGNSTHRLEILYSTLPDQQTPLTVDSLLSKTAPYRETEVLRMASRNDYSRAWEMQERILRQKIGLGGFMLLRKVFANLPGDFAQMENANNIGDALALSLDQLDPQVETPRLEEAIRLCQQKSKELQDHDFPAAIQHVLGGIQAIINEDPTDAKNKFNRIAVTHCDLNYESIKTGKANASIAGNPLNTGKTRASGRAEKKDAAKSRNEPKQTPRLTAVEREPLDKKAKHTGSTQRRQRRRKVARSMPTEEFAKAGVNTTPESHRNESLSSRATSNRHGDGQFTRRKQRDSKKQSNVEAEVARKPLLEEFIVTDKTKDTGNASEYPSKLQAITQDSRQHRVYPKDLQEFQARKTANENKDSSRKPMT